ncbi:hypothetical protein V1514DRAFT_327859 [Lipomyces japonicus]|uniref:uncharacterized protein n=1 Tax=Lipomyces japonicus TaxID=56871 RepID=UPI0034CE404F
MTAESKEAVTEEAVDDIDEVEGDQRNILLSIISSLRPGSDLSRITLPTFILERKSMLERITNQLAHPYLLLEAHNTEDPIERFVNVTKWYLSGWHITPKAVKKPLNPVLSEHFTCYWDLPDGTKAYYIAEQTSHHPPKSSYFYMSPENHIRVDGTLVPRSRFLGNSAASLMEGIAYLSFNDKQDFKGQEEKYELTQPNMYARNILIGKLKYELGDHSFVRCPGNDLIADIEFKVKGFISGTYNAILGKIIRESTGDVLYEITGKWNELLEIKNLKTGKKSVFFDSSTAKPQFPKVRPISEQGPLESRRLWLKVTNALAKQNHDEATEEKFIIEDRQRQETKQREEEGVEWHPRLFKQTAEPLEWIIHKDIDAATPEEQVKQILSIAPILEGQTETHQFDIPPRHSTEVKQ